MRIAQFISSGTANGATRYCLALTEKLAARGHDLMLLHRQWWEDPIVLPGVRIEQSEFVLPEVPRVMRMLREHGTEVLHTHMSGAHGFAGLLKFVGGPPMAATCHSRHVQPHWMLNDLVFTLSERSARYQRFVNLVPGRKIEVIPTFLGCQFFEPATPAERAAARAALGVGPDTVLIGQAADIHFDKRQADLVLAVRRLADEGLDVMLALKGADHDPIEGRKLEAAVAGAENRVLRLPRDGRVGAFMHALDIFCISSGREEGPNVAVEAMSAGLPMVSTRVGRMAELSGGETTALLTPPRDVEAMAAALRRLVLDAGLRQRMGEAARAMAVVEHDAEHVVDRIEAGLLRIGDQRRRPRA